MSNRDIKTIETVPAELQAAVLALNNEHAEELSWLEPEQLSALLGEAFYARRIGALEAFIMTFDQSARYDSPNFLWFRGRYPRFVYVDRVVVAAEARGRGHARRLYEDLFAHAARAGHSIVTCEVNAEPPNPASDAFHAALGFAEVGSAAIQLGKAFGAGVIATAGGPEKVAFCKELGADEAIDYRDGGFAEAVVDATFGAGVDVALDAVGGSVTQETFRCMGMNGRILLVGYAEDITNDGAPLNPAPAIYGNFGLLGVICIGVLYGLMTGGLMRWSAFSSTLSIPNLITIAATANFVNIEADLSYMLTNLAHTVFGAAIGFAALRFMKIYRTGRRTRKRGRPSRLPAGLEHGPAAPNEGAAE